MAAVSTEAARLAGLLTAYRCGEDMDRASIGGRVTAYGLEAEARELRRVINALGDWARATLATLAYEGADDCDPAQADVIEEACLEALVSPLEDLADSLRRFPDDGSDDAYEARRDREDA